MRERAGKASIYRKLFYVLAGVGVLGLVWLGSRKEGERKERITASLYREAEASSVMPAQILGGLILLRPEELVAAPEIDGFQWPCGSPSGAMMYDAQGFGALNATRRGHHTGKDINGIGGENTDLGEPVCAAGRGLVVYSGRPTPEWGNVVVLLHRLPGEDGYVQTLYAHLRQRDVRVGQYVARGQRLGRIGTADGRYLAHLHFEAIPSLCTEAGMPGYHPTGTMNRMNPEELLRKYPAPNFPDAYSEARMLRVREAAEHERNSRQPTVRPAPDEPGVLHVSPSQFLTP